MMHIIKITKHVNKLLAGLPQIIGFLCFYIILNLEGNYRELVASRIVSYQIIISISSLIILGLSYTNFISVFKKKNFFYAGIVFLFIGLIEFFFFKSLFCSLVVAIFLIGSLINLSFIKFKRPRIEYIIISSVFAFILPISLILNIYALVGIFVLECFFLFFYLNEKKEKLDNLSGLSFYNILLSIAFQAPFFIFNVYDEYLKLFLGLETYLNYLLFMKITNGALVYFYAQFQISILYNEFENLAKINIIKYNLIIIFLILLFSFFLLNNTIVFFIVISLYNVFINNMSLYVRMNLMKSKYNFNKLWKPLLSFLLYSSSILFFSFFPSYVMFFLFVGALSILILMLKKSV